MLIKKIVTLSAIIFASVAAEEAAAPVPQIEVTTALSKELYAPGDTVLVALQITIPKEHHFFDNPLGPGIGKPMTYTIADSGAVAWLDLLKTRSKKYPAEIGGWFKGFEGSVCFFLRGVVKQSGATSGEYNGTLNISGLICATACHPVDKNVSITVKIDKSVSPAKLFQNDARLAGLLARAIITQSLERPAAADSSMSNGTLGNISTQTGAQAVPAWNYKPQQAKTAFNIWIAIFFAFVAGIIMNAMPCVLPVLGVKILSFAQGRSMGRRKAIMHSLVFSAGVISVFLLLACLASFANYSWGRQFQDPKALIAIVAFIVIFALGLFDVYMITVPSTVSNLEGKSGGHGMWSDFFKGVFATVLATPCSGPFLGAVLAWLVTQPPYVIFIVYGFIGIGMGFPYIVLSASERFARMVPRPGPWMDDFKKIMGFLLLGFAAYLMLGLPQDFIIPTVIFCITISLGVVVYGRFAPWGSAAGRKVVTIACALIIAAAGFHLAFRIVYPAFSAAAAETVTEKDKVWQDFNADSLLKANAEGRSAIVDFTANWCMNCQYNYLMVLSKKEITDLLRKKNVLALKVDMTAKNTIQDSLLHSLGSQSIPFLAVFPGDRPNSPVVMRDVLTKGQVVRAIKALR